MKYLLGLSIGLLGATALLVLAIVASERWHGYLHGWPRP